MIKTFYPKQVINLYDASSDVVLRGEMYFEINKNDSQILKFWNLIYDDFNKFQIDFFKKCESIFSLKRVAYIFFFISIFGFSTLLFPFIAGIVDQSIDSKTMIKKIENPNDQANAAFEVKAGENEIIDNTFKLFIPKIGLDSDIVLNVDTTTEAIYKQKLQYGVAHANGSYFPGQKGPVFLFAHSTDTVAHILEYNAKFFDINKLEAGDSVQIYFRGKNYQYIITKKEIINPNDLELIRTSNANLILQTCWPLGTDWQRLVLFADQIS